MVKDIKKGVNMWSFPGDMSIFQRMVRARELGFEGIELCMSLSGDEFSLDTSDEDVKKLREQAREAGIEISSLCSGLYFQYSLTSAREDIREGAKRVIKRLIDCAVILECSSVLAVPGIVGADFRPEEVVPDVSQMVYSAGAEIVPYDVAYERSLAAFRELAPYAESRKVCIGVENIWGKFLLSPLEMRDFIDAVGSEYVKSYFDVGNSALFGYPEQWLRILGSRVVNIHLKDFRRGTAQLSGFCDLLSGDVDWYEVGRALDDIDYSGWVNAEMTPVYKTYPEQIAESTSLAMDRILRRRK